ncbi:DUF3806 domain-containing protein [Fuerstiella marisgermanici]|uniref:DUF3806 domain-containing protein n=1 Tax=Fuerstiella marisgermanici TaxID=1891926 RepID=A0A1P8WPY0_9PLAN|nr:DUF3806 domain-containing protein [Fuerstiella marisgermanici]APZ96085.1 hypothetical protein Fuma_05753 [Fuerstiella marisgermanici]
MEPEYRPPSHDEFKWLASRWMGIVNLVREEYDEELDQSKDAMHLLQRLLDNDIIDRGKHGCEGLGVALGRIMVSNLDGFDWWHVKDEFGADLCLRYEHTTLQLNPISMMLRRGIEGSPINIPGMYAAIETSIDEAKRQLHDE